MSHGSLIIGYSLDLSKLKNLEFDIDDFQDEITKITGNQLDIFGGRKNKYKSNHSMAFIAKPVIHLQEECNGTNKEKISDENLKKSRRWLSQLPKIKEVRAYLSKNYPEIVISETAEAFLIMENVFFTTSTELLLGQSGTLSYNEERGWRLEGDLQLSRSLSSINEDLATQEYSLTKSSYKAYCASIEEDDDDDFYDDFIIDQKFKVIKILEKLGAPNVDLYDEHATSWSVIFGETISSLYKGDYLVVPKSKLNIPEGAKLYLKVQHSG